MRTVEKEVTFGEADGADATWYPETTVKLVAEVPETIDEYLQRYGGEENVVKILSRFEARNAHQAGVNKFNNSIKDVAIDDKAAFEKLIEDVTKAVSGYKFEIGDGLPTGTELKKAVGSIKSMSAEDRAKLSKEEMFKMLGIDVS